MKPRAARKRLLMIWIGAFALGLVYAALLEPLDIPIVNALVYAALLALFILFCVISNKYYRCTKCGRSLTFLGKVTSSNTCHHCGAPLE